MRFLLYSHDGLGLGHTRRHLAIASALAELAPESAVLLATGADDVERIGLPPYVEVLKLPGLRKVANGQYSSRRLRIPASQIRALRSALLLTAVESFEPDVVLADKHPFGARGEFQAALESLRQHGAKTALGLRDILDDPATVRNEWLPQGLPERIGEFYDLVLIYGQRSVFNPVAAYGLPQAVAERCRFCGYVLNEEQKGMQYDIPWSKTVSDEHRQPVVLATVGGGEDGYALLETFIEAASRASWRGIAVSGPLMPADELAVLKRSAASADIELHEFASHLSCLFWSVDALVCAGGYNTLAEAVSKGVPTICVPRTSPRSEQLIRALAFERLGLLSVIRPDELTADALCRELDAAMRSPRSERFARANAALKFDGARHAAKYLLELAAGERPDLWGDELSAVR